MLSKSGVGIDRERTNQLFVTRLTRATENAMEANGAAC